MMAPMVPNLSYIIYTFNRLPYLSKSLELLIAHKNKDEEIIIVDGGSTDGTGEYLRQLHERGAVDQFVSEPDLGTAHAVNKGFLMAKGKLVKQMNDDDEYYLDEVQKMKTFMLEHPDIDVINSNGIDQFGNTYRREEDFLIRKNSAYHPFMMADQGMVIRRSSLSVIGLADTSFTFWDGEFTVRLTAGKARMAWYTGITWKHVFNPTSLSLTKGPALWKVESARLRQMYPIYSSWKHFIPKPIVTLIRSILPKKTYVTAELVKRPTFLT